MSLIKLNTFSLNKFNNLKNLKINFQTHLSNLSLGLNLEYNSNSNFRKKGNFKITMKSNSILQKANLRWLAEPAKVFLKQSDFPSAPKLTDQAISLNKVFAVVQSCGKQYKVSIGDVVVLSKLIGTNVGDKILFNKVLLIGSTTWTAIGKPILTKAKIEALIQEQTLGQRVTIFKKKKRKTYKKFTYARHPITVIKITKILVDYDKIKQQVLKEQKLTNFALTKLNTTKTTNSNESTIYLNESTTTTDSKDSKNLVQRLKNFYKFIK
eukprot:TRINITY_DN516_c0_g1_i3.p1 TRINITY_DN516_c0_g1~~TRINITY_DN516_c0_g1_i3.p1  ORF type:complete len:267 (-),score=117.00 TRINITY_DN516_c0_g1_i3:46-846(-)